MTTERPTAFLSTPFFRALLGFCLFSIVALIWLRLNPKPESYEQKRAAVRSKLLADLHADEAKKLNSYAWIDEKKGVVQIPIGRAEEIMLAELKTKTAQPTAVKVENPYPTGLQPAATPAARAVPAKTAPMPAAAPAATATPAPGATPASAATKIPEPKQ